MNQQTLPTWESMRTEETRTVENLLRQRFSQCDAYRYNSASIRIRVIDASFEKSSTDERYQRVESLLQTLPEETQRDIISLTILAPSELQRSLRAQLMNLEFEEPSRDEL